MTKPKRVKETYHETYRKGEATIRKELLPETFPFTSVGFVVDSIEMIAAGAMDDGREFQEIRIFVREKENTDAKA